MLFVDFACYDLICTDPYVFFVKQDLETLIRSGFSWSFQKCKVQDVATRKWQRCPLHCWQLYNHKHSPRDLCLPSEQTKCNM